MTEANIGAFKPFAKKYGVDFNLRKDKTPQPTHYVVIFKAKASDNLDLAFRVFTATTLSKEQRPSIRTGFSAVKQKAAAQTKQRAKEKIKERGLEL
ncbi:PcfB family protein [Enterococcus faecium]|uniref:PcfB family protein n=1 Tax=Enterococcus faecium TaxID=1352 RepID=UPI0035A6DE7F